jgi:prepilin-type N-terminal cleavage/methylation domain-containing protein
MLKQEVWLEKLPPRKRRNCLAKGLRMILSRTRQKSGFTIVELMTTVVIIGLVSAMAAPQLQKAFERNRFRSRVKDMTSTLRLARSSAITDKVPYGICLNTEAMTMTLFKDLVTPENYDFVTGDSVVRVDTLPPEIVWMGTDVTNNVITYIPSGAAGFSGGGNLYMLASSRDVVAFSSTNVLASTGRVQSSFWHY